MDIMATRAPKTFVVVPMALQKRAKSVLRMVIVYVRRVTLDMTKLQVEVLILGEVGAQELFVLVPTAIRQLLQHVPFPHVVWIVSMDITKLAVHVIKTFVIVPMALQQRAQRVLPMVPIYVRLVPVNITKVATHALHALHVTLVK